MYQRVGIAAILLFAVTLTSLFADAQTPSNSPPLANAGPNQKVGTKALQAVAVTLSGAGSFDPDGDPLSYEWRDGNGNAVGNTPVVTVSLLPGSYVFALTVRDGRGGTGSAGASVRVLVDDGAPLVTPPADVAVAKTESNGARGANSGELSRFLAGGSASDALDGTPTRLPPQVNGADVDGNTLFPIGTTVVVFRFADRAGNIGSAPASVTVIDGLEPGDLLVGAGVAGQFGETSGLIARVRNGNVSTWCQSPTSTFDPNFWNIPAEVIVDSRGQVVFLAYTASLFHPGHNFALFRCNLPGAPAEKIAVFRGNDPIPAGDSVPFPDFLVRGVSGLHLTRVTSVSIDNQVENGTPRMATEDTYIFVADTTLGTGERVQQTLRYHPAANVWDAAGPRVLQDSFFNLPDVVNHAGSTYSVLVEGAIQKLIEPIRCDVSLKLGNFFGKLSLALFGGGATVSSGGLDDVTIPNVDSHCPGADLIPLGEYGPAFKVMTGWTDVVYDEWGGLGLVLQSNSGAAGTPYLTKVSEKLLNGEPGPRWASPFNGCTLFTGFEYESILPFFAPDGSGFNGVDRLASTKIGLVGTQRVQGKVVQVSPSFGGKVQTLASGLVAPLGIAGFPGRVASSIGFVLAISIESPVNVMVTDPAGRRLGLDLSTGAAVNDFGENGYDTGPTEPRYFLIKNPTPGDYSVRTVGTGSGPFTVNVYSADLAQTYGQHLSTTGITAPGSARSHDFTLGASGRIDFAAANRAPVADAGPDRRADAVSEAGAAVTLDGSASSDPDGDPLTLTWFGPFGVLTGAVIAPTLPPGVHAITLLADDGRGGSATARVLVTVVPPAAPQDTTPPVITHGIARTLGNGGWSVSDVLVTWTVTDPESAISSSSGCGASAVTSDTGGVTFTCSATSAGGTATSSVTIKRDTTKPRLVFGPANPAPNPAGWNATDVSFPFTASDNLSGVASSSVASPLVLTSEGTSVSGSVTLTDGAGNSGTFQSPASRIDKTPPAITVTTPANGTAYLLNQALVSNYGCSDRLSGLVACMGPAPSGTSLDTAAAGARTFTVIATDAAGNVARSSISYSIGYRFVGFLSPVQNLPSLNVGKAGRSYPVKWQLLDANGAPVSDTGSFTSLKSAPIACDSSQPSGPGTNVTASGGTALRYDPASGQFIFNWQTDSSWSGCRLLQLTLADYSQHLAKFSFQ